MAQEFSSSDEEDVNETVSSEESDNQSEISFEPDKAESITSETKESKCSNSAFIENYQKLPPYARPDANVSFYICDKKTKNCSELLHDEFIDYFQNRFDTIRLIDDDEWKRVFCKKSRPTSKINAIRELLSQSKDLSIDIVKRHLLIAEKNTVSHFCIIKNRMIPDKNYKNVPEQIATKNMSWCVTYLPENLLKLPRAGQIDYLMEIRTILMYIQVTSLFIYSIFSTP